MATTQGLRNKGRASTSTASAPSTKGPKRSNRSTDRAASPHTTTTSSSRSVKNMARL